MLAALEKTRERLGDYKTVGKMFACDPEFQGRRRNREGVYDRTAQRSDIEAEAHLLFDAQRRFGQDFANPDLEKAYCDIAFFQRPLQDSEAMVGHCPFEPDEKRASRFAPSFERFRLLQRLAHMRIENAGEIRALSPDEISKAVADLGATAKITVKRVRERLGLPDTARFQGIKPEDESRDIAARTGEAVPGTRALRHALTGKLWSQATERPELLDQIAHVLTFFETEKTILEELKALELDEAMKAALSAALEQGMFARFKGAAHISTKAARALTPHLSEGKPYSEACALAGYDHSATGLRKRDAIVDRASFKMLLAEVSDGITNPVARKALSEGLKQIWVLKNQFGLPGAICIELARDVGNSIDKRREIERGLEKSTKAREDARKEASELLGEPDISGTTLLRYRLWKEQGGECVYTGRHIPPNTLQSDNATVQVDHILPWSRFGDDSFNNKTLCFASANQAKRNSTPYEWLQSENGETGWDLFQRRIDSNSNMRGFKKRNYLLRDAKAAEERFKSRNLNDTRYAARVLAEAARLFYPTGDRQEKGGRRRVFTRPGALTAALRHAWGLDALKRVDKVRVEDDRHHAVDAVVVAAVSESEIMRLTRAFQQWEREGRARPLGHVDEPWPGFRDQAQTVIYGPNGGPGKRGGVFVARAERRRARGAGHDATIRQVREEDGAPVIYERKSVDKLTKADIARIKDPDRNVNGAVKTSHLGAYKTSH